IVERIGITSRSQVNQEVVVTSVRCRVRIWKQRRDRTLDKFVGLPSPPPGFLHLPDRVGVLHGTPTASGRSRGGALEIRRCVAKVMQLDGEPSFHAALDAHLLHPVVDCYATR